MPSEIVTDIFSKYTNSFNFSSRWSLFCFQPLERLDVRKIIENKHAICNTEVKTLKIKTASCVCVVYFKEEKFSPDIYGCLLDTH